MTTQWVTAITVVVMLIWYADVHAQSITASNRKQISSNTLQLATVSEPGIRLTIYGYVRNRGGHPIADAELHIYQADASGRYTPEKPMDEPHARLSGWIRTVNDGRFELRTIRPGGYPLPIKLGDRERKIPAHIHIDIAASGYRKRQVQVVFADDPLLTDSYWIEWVKKLKQPVLTVRSDENGVVGELIIILE